MPNWKHVQNSSIEPSAKDWSRIVAFYADLAQHNNVFEPMAELATLIARSPYVTAGLSALTSMHVLVLGPSKNILSNPHLRVSWESELQAFRFEYDNGSTDRWTRIASRAEAFDVLVRFLTKGARWYRNVEGANHE